MPRRYFENVQLLHYSLSSVYRHGAHEPREEQSGLDDALTRDAYWQALHPDKKREFVVDDYRAIVHHEIMWSSLLSDSSYSDEVIHERRRAAIIGPGDASQR